MARSSHYARLDADKIAETIIIVDSGQLRIRKMGAYALKPSVACAARKYVFSRSYYSYVTMRLQVGRYSTYLPTNYLVAKSYDKLRQIKKTGNIQAIAAL